MNRIDNRDVKIKNGLMAALILLLLISGVFIIKGALDGHFESEKTLRAYIDSFGFFGPMILTLIQLFQVVIPVLPGFLGCIVGAGIFGTAGGFFCNYLGISAGSILAFLLAQRFGVSLVQKMVPMEKYEACVEWVNNKRSYTVALFLAILLPLAPDDFFCYFSGLTGMSTRKFVWIIILGKPWCILAYSIFFGYLL